MVGIMLLAAAAVADVVERRGSAPAIEGEVTAIDDAGVTVRSPLGAVHFVAWDRVRRVETDPEGSALARHMETAVALWRARSRVERNDTTLAEPLLERLF
ncbi:MAG: PH domain-containing protein, partial [Planctomycetota bacterium]